MGRRTNVCAKNCGTHRVGDAVERCSVNVAKDIQHDSNGKQETLHTFPPPLSTQHFSIEVAIPLSGHRLTSRLRAASPPRKAAV